jgi:succinyl-CoA synthetase beta subunit
MLLEHHAKELLSEAGVAVPQGYLVRSAVPFKAPFWPAIVKAQVPVGGRGKAGGILKASSETELRAAIDRVFALRIKGHPVRSVRLERPVTFRDESYLSFAVDASNGDVRVLVAAKGGVDVEDSRHEVLSSRAKPDLTSVLEAVDELLSKLPAISRNPLREAARQLAPIFFSYEALLLEINPLFVLSDGSFVLGDAKFVIDENVLPRQPALRSIIESNKDLYPEMALKLEQGFDFAILDEDGDIGLVTTGAGLSMQLVDELIARGHRPFNFCDIRTGGFKGDPARLVQVFRWIAQGPAIRSVFMNFFAGMTNLGELAHLLVLALDRVPELRALPITARLIGNGLDEARAILKAAGNPIVIETDLERAIDLATRSLGDQR